MKMKIVRSRLLSPLFLLLIALFLVSIWFKKGLMIAGGEGGFPFYNLERTVSLYSSTWRDSNIGLTAIADLSKLPFFFIAKQFYLLGVPSLLIQAGTYLILMFTGSISVYFLVKELLGERFQNKSIPLIAGFFYLLNPYSMSQIWGRGLLMQYFPFALHPLFLFLFILGLRRRNFIYGILAILASFGFSGAFNSIGYVVSFWLLPFVYFLFHIWTERRKKGTLLYSIGFFVFVLIFWVLTQLWWILPYIRIGKDLFERVAYSSRENIGTLLGLAPHMTFFAVIRLVQNGIFFLGKYYGEIYSTFYFQLISLFVPVISFFSLKYLKKNKELRYFAILFVVGLFVSMGANPPFGKIFVWFFKRFSFLQVFRNPYEKFGIVLMLAYAPFFAIGLTEVSKKLKKRFFATGLVILLVFGIYLWPIWTGRIFAGPDGKIGVKIPDYYKGLDNWFKRDGAEDFRVFMTPLVSGDGVVYEWEEAIYNGVDPSVFLIEPSAISYLPNIPNIEMIKSIRRRIGRENMTSTLALLRAKYLVSRGDTRGTKFELAHEEYLTNSFYSPTGTTSTNKVICENIIKSSEGGSPPWLGCELSKEDGDLSEARYLHLVVKSSEPSVLEIAVRDRAKIRPRWDGRVASEYLTKGGEFEVITIPLGAPTEYTDKMDYSNVELIEIVARSLNSAESPVAGIVLKGIWLDSGKEVEVSDYKFIRAFGRLNLYEMKEGNFPPEFGIVKTIQNVEGFPELFEIAAEKQKFLDTKAFVIKSQNSDKNFEDLAYDSKVEVIDSQKISRILYWLELGSADGAYIVLSKSFNPGWKVIPGVEKNEIGGGFRQDLSLIRRVSISEDRHFIVNGYANLWKVNVERDGKYAIVFLPQIYADVGLSVSTFIILALGGVVFMYFVKRKIISK